MTKFRQLIAGLTPVQTGIVTVALMGSVVLAIALIWIFRRWNTRQTEA